jgi:hypothetical protein
MNKEKVMKSWLLVLAASAFIHPGGARGGEGKRPDASLSPRTLELVQRLAAEKDLVQDIEIQNQGLTDEGRVEELRERWTQSTDRSGFITAYREKASSRTLIDYFAKDVSLVDCYALDAQGRVVSMIYKPQDFLQDQQPQFTECFNGGEGRLWIETPGVVPGVAGALEIAVPIRDGARTVGVLVATVLPDHP